MDATQLAEICRAFNADGFAGKIQEIAEGQLVLDRLDAEKARARDQRAALKETGDRLEAAEAGLAEKMAALKAGETRLAKDRAKLTADMDAMNIALDEKGKLVRQREAEAAAALNAAKAREKEAAEKSEKLQTKLNIIMSQAAE